MSSASCAGPGGVPPTRSTSGGLAATRRFSAGLAAGLVLGLGAQGAAVPLHPASAKPAGDLGTFGDLSEARRNGLDAPAERRPRLPARVLVLLVDFADRPHAASITNDVVDSLFFAAGTASGPIVSVRDFYTRSSFGRLQLEGQVVGWLRLPETHDFYADAEHEGLGVRGAYPRNARRMVEDAVRAADPFIDLRAFDDDGPDAQPSSGDDDGLVDALVVVHAGAGADRGDRREIMSHNWTTTEVVRSAEGVGAWHYATVAETSPLGTLAHEYAHQLGLPDLYQSGSIFGLGGGLGNWSLMAAGPWLGNGDTPADLDAASKIDLGFVDPIVTEANSTGLALRASHTGLPGDVYLVWTHGRPDLEYFVIENRQPRNLDVGLPGGGMLVYHVDRSAWNNDVADHPRVALLQADGREDIERRINNGDARDPYPGLQGILGAETLPSSRARDGSDTQVRITNISSPTPSMTFDLRLETTPRVEIVSQAVREVSGDGDGIAEAGERAGLDLVLHNIGLDAAPLEVRLGSRPVTDALWVIDSATIPRLAKRDSTRVSFEFVPRTGLSDPYAMRTLAVFRTSTWTDSTTRDVGLGTKAGFQACLQARASRFTRDCSDPASAWSVDHRRGPGEWTLEMRPEDLGSVYRSASGSRYGNGVDVALVSPAFRLEAASVLRLLHSFATQAAPGGWAYDGGRVELSVDGDDWQAIEPRGGAPLRIYPPSVPALAGARVFGGSSPRRWDVFDLGPRAGSARVRFRFVSGDSIGAAGWEIARVEVLPASVPEPSGVRIELAVEPNPARLPTRIAFRITSPLTESARPTTLGVYDLRGRLVRVLTHAPAPSGWGAFSWDGTDTQGRTVASGVYLARLDWGSERATAKVLVLH